MIRVKVRAPSNIAIVKYMGKKDAFLNIPANDSLSLTLNTLCTELKLSRNAEAPEVIEIFSKLTLNKQAKERFVKHIDRLKSSCSVENIGRIEVQTDNTFPTGSGIASSASSFAALTLAAFTAFDPDPKRFFKEYYESTRQNISRLSRQGSGSSCRSFDGPWVYWSGEQAKSIESKMPALCDIIVVVSDQPKLISSSEAHMRVKTSPLWGGRAERANARAQELKVAIGAGDFTAFSKIAWDELWEMHSLFHTSKAPFSYWMPESLAVLQALEPFVHEREIAVTMDAGPNVHVLVRQEHADEWLQKLQSKFSHLCFLKDDQGTGAAIIDCSVQEE